MNGADHFPRQAQDGGETARGAEAGTEPMEKNQRHSSSEFVCPFVSPASPRVGIHYSLIVANDVSI